MNKKLNERITMPVLISSLWIFLSLNYIFCDVLSNMEKEAITALITGEVAGIVLSQGFLLLAGISLEIPFAMVVFSRILPLKANKITNIVAAIIMIAYQLSSFTVGTPPTIHYIFYSIIEVGVNMLILVLALKWKTIIEK